MVAPRKENYDKPRQHIKKQRHHFANKGPYSQSDCISSSHVWMWELNYKESWKSKNWCFWIVMLEMTLESPLDSKEIKPVNPKWNQHWHLKEWCWCSNTLAIWYEELTHWKRPWCWKRQKAKEKGWWKMRRLDSITDSVDINLSKLQEIVERGAWCAAVHGVTKSQIWLSDWITSLLLQTPTILLNSWSVYQHIKLTLDLLGSYRLLLFFNNNPCLTTWTAAHQASLSFTISWSLLKIKVQLLNSMSIELVMPSNHLILCCPIFLQLSIFPNIGVFPMSQFFTLGSQNIGASASASILPMNIQGWFPLELIGLVYLLSKGHSSMPYFEGINSLVLSLLYGPTSHLYMTTRKTIALTLWTFVSKVMILLLYTV